MLLQMKEYQKKQKNKQENKRIVVLFASLLIY